MWWSRYNTIINNNTNNEKERKYGGSSDPNTIFYQWINNNIIILRSLNILLLFWCIQEILFLSFMYLGNFDFILFYCLLGLFLFLCFLLVFLFCLFVSFSVVCKVNYLNSSARGGIYLIWSVLIYFWGKYYATFTLYVDRTSLKCLSRLI